MQRLVKGLGFSLPPGELAGEIGEWRRVTVPDEPQPENGRLSRWDFLDEQEGSFGANLLGVDGLRFTVDQPAVEGILDVRAGVGHAKQAPVVGFIFGEQDVLGRVGVEAVAAEARMVGGDGGRIL